MTADGSCQGEVLGNYTSMECGRWDLSLVSVSGSVMLLSHDNLMMISECGVFNIIFLLEKPLCRAEINPGSHELFERSRNI